MPRTVGLSRKLAATLLGAIGAQTIALIVNWISSGTFDRVEVAQLVSLAGTAILGVLAGVLAPADTVTHTTATSRRGTNPTAGQANLGLIISVLLIVLLVVLVVVLARHL